MATTTTAFNGTNVNIQYEDHSHVLTNCEGDMNNFAFEGSSDIGDYAVFKNDYKFKLVGKKDSTLSIDIVNSLGASTTLRWALDWWHLYHDEAREISINFPDSNPGSERIRGHFVLETLPVGASADEAGPMMTSLSLQSTGEVFHEVVGS